MHAKTPHHERVRRKQAIYLTVAAGLSAAALVVSMIVFCYQSSHLRM